MTKNNFFYFVYNYFYIFIILQEVDTEAYPGLLIGELVQMEDGTYMQPLLQKKTATPTVSPTTTRPVGRISLVRGGSRMNFGGGASIFMIFICEYNC